MVEGEVPRVVLPPLLPQNVSDKLGRESSLALPSVENEGEANLKTLQAKRPQNLLSASILRKLLIAEIAAAVSGLTGLSCILSKV